MKVPQTIIASVKKVKDFEASLQASVLTGTTSITSETNVLRGNLLGKGLQKENSLARKIIIAVVIKILLNVAAGSVYVISGIGNEMYNSYLGQLAYTGSGWIVIAYYQQFCLIHELSAAATAQQPAVKHKRSKHGYSYLVWLANLQDESYKKNTGGSSKKSMG